MFLQTCSTSAINTIENIEEMFGFFFVAIASYKFWVFETHINSKKPQKRKQRFQIKNVSFLQIGLRLLCST